jgi:DeoR/GlpR family transcriptional regulator of sugar metabolism
MDRVGGTGEAFARERQQQIARVVEEHGRARVADLARQFAVSGVTIRKDLLVLESVGRLVRTHGGAIAVEKALPERAFDLRERLQRDEKARIAAAAAASVQDGDSIALDASTTALALARQLRSEARWTHLTVLTNGLRIASELAGVHGITVAMPGGWVRWEALSVVGSLGDGLFDRVNIQKTFVGAAGFTLDSGLSDAQEEEAQIKRSMVSAAREVIAIVDHTKWQRAAFATFCRIDQIDVVLTDDRAPGDMVAALIERGIRVDLLRDPAAVAPDRVEAEPGRTSTDPAH